MERRPRVGDGDRCARETLNSLAVTEESDLLDGARPTGALTSPAHANSRQIPQFDLKVLSTAGMYLLFRYLGGGRLAAAWSGLVYIVFPWHLMRVPHASLVHLEFLPLLVVALIAAARRPAWTRFGLIAATTLACWLTSGYFGAMAVITTVAFALGASLTPTIGLRRVRF